MVGIGRVVNNNASEEISVEDYDKKKYMYNTLHYTTHIGEYSRQLYI